MQNDGRIGLSIPLCARCVKSAGHIWSRREVPDRQRGTPVGWLRRARRARGAGRRRGEEVRRGVTSRQAETLSLPLTQP